jgi:hypothetical protein
MTPRPQGTTGGARRTVRLRRRRGRDTDGDDMVIRAVVHARLLGLRLLTLDARVVVGSPQPADGVTLDPDATVLSPSDVVLPLPGEASLALPLASGRRPASLGRASDLAQAKQLLAQGADTLQRARRPV